MSLGWVDDNFSIRASVHMRLTSYVTTCHASINENANIVCFLILQDTTSPAKRKYMYLEVDFFISLHPPN